MLLPTLLFGAAWALTNGRWCEQMETLLVEEEVTPRQEDPVPCASLYHHVRQGWRVNLSSGGSAGLSHLQLVSWGNGDQKGNYMRDSLRAPPETWPVAWNRTVRACCRWGGPDRTVALADASPEGHRFATWRCQPQAGSANGSAGRPEGCCAQPWGHSWRDGRSQACLSCPSQQLPGSTPSPAPLQPLAGAVAQLWSQRQRPSATCATWSGFHYYRAFDGHHYHFLGRCTYLLAGAADSTWAVHLSPGGPCSQPGHCQLARVLMGPEEVLIRGRNVSVNGQLVPEGESQLLPGLSLQWQGDWLVLSGGLGVVVRLDRSGSVSVSVDHELQGQTRGLCGVYNGRREDDFLEPGGGLAALAATFGNSWRLPDSEPGCLDALEAAQGCEEPLGSSEAGVEAGRLRAEARDGAASCWPAPSENAMPRSQRALAGRAVGRPVCATLANYAQDCARRGIHVLWRKPGFCERLCPGDQLYSDCASACPPSCSAGDGAEGSCGEECVSSCECPSGLPRDGALCVPAARCPCFHRRQRYAPGDTVRQRCNPCVCKDCRWLCAQAPCPSECAVGGDGHYLTFDGRSCFFRGSPGCRSVLVQDLAKGQLLVALEHWACDSGSCLHAISVSLGDAHVQLRDSGAVLAHGQDVGLPWSSPVGLSVARASSAFLLLHWPGAQVLWGVSDSAAYITPDPRHAHQVQGLCGTFTWNQQDDFLTPAGDVETSIAAFAFASKFQLAGEGRCPSEDSTPLSPCSTHTQHHDFAETVCAILNGPAFQECHGLVGRELFHRRCLAAVCGCAPGRDCLCPVLAAYARHCAQEGAPSPWRNQTLCCETAQAAQQPPVSSSQLGGLQELRRGAGMGWDPRRTSDLGRLLAEGARVQKVGLSSCHGGQRYPPNTTIQEDCNICVCQGRQWHCTGQRYGGWCQALGAPQYVTFDGLALAFPGACEYLLVREAGGQFTVSAQNLPCGASGLTCTKALTVRLQSTVVHMLRGRAVTVNGVSVTLPKVYTSVLEPGARLESHRLENFPVPQPGFSWGTPRCTSFLLSPPIIPTNEQTNKQKNRANQRPLSAGLCGDFDGDASNDLRSRQGVLEPTAELAAHSWRLSPLCPEPGDLPHPCTVNAHPAAWARARCGVLLQPLCARCHAEVPPQQHYECCMYDACGCDSGGDCECLCSAIATYAAECSWRGLHVRWRGQELCPLQCEGGQVYKACGPTCPPTCHDHGPEAGHCQAVTCVEGCFCPEGTLLHGGVCLEPASCPCEWGGRFFPPGTALQEDCGNCTCQDSQWLCGGDGARCEEPRSGCAEGEARCVPHEWLCDDQDDCGDGSDEEGCAAPGCGEGRMSCSSGLGLSLALLCDGHPDCPDAADEESCLGHVSCTPGEVPCVDGTCVGVLQLCDGIWDCPDGADAGPGHGPLPSLPTPPAGTLPSGSAGSLAAAPTPLAGTSPARPCGALELPCGSGECTPRGWRCNGEDHCTDCSDQRGGGARCAHPDVPCATARTAPTRARRPALCLHLEQLCDGVTNCPQGEDELACQEPPVPGGPNRTGAPCPEYSCPDGLCISFQLVCNGKPDCEVASEAKVSPEEQASPGPFPVPTTALPGLPPSRALCSSRQLTCGSGEYLPPERRFDLRPDCQDGSNEDGCADCRPAPWCGGSHCSRSCGLGVAFQRGELLQPPLPGGGCPPDRLRSRSCFVQACPVAGAWTVWEAWGPCSVSCGGGHRSRRRSCEDPPASPKNGGAPCPGASQERTACGLQACTGDTDCGRGRVRVSAELCQKGRVPPCPASCLDPEANRSCGGHCLGGCRSPGLLLHDTSCLPLSECPCLVGGELRQPGLPFLPDNCSRCWSAWSSWGPCDRSCGSGVRARFRSPSNPPAAFGSAPCEGHAQELQACHTECGTGALGWTPWTPSACSRSCLAPGGGPGWHRRSRVCPSLGDMSCPGEAAQEEPCSPPVCPAPSTWGVWAPWSPCSAPCDGGIQTRGRSCSGSAAGDAECQGPHGQTRDCNTQPCQRPGDVVFRSAKQCHQEGGLCPRLCLVQGPGVQCTGSCAPGCACPPGLFLHNASCLPRTQCPCQVHGRLYEPEAVAQLDPCHNCACVSVEMVCTSERCPVACWSPWTPWSLCSRSCNVGIRRRFRLRGAAQARNWKMTAGFGFQNNVCVPAQDCPCAHGGRLHPPGSTALRPCDNCSCVSGLITNCTSWPCTEGERGARPDSAPCGIAAAGVACAGALEGSPSPQPRWSSWTLWSECLASCGAALRHRHRFCARLPGMALLPPRASPTPFSPGPEAEEEPCTLLACDRAGGWGPWGPWSSCSRSCGGGLRSHTRACDQPPPQGLGDYCEGPRAQGEVCWALPCPVTNCTSTEGAEFSPCSPLCPRSCDDLAFPGRFFAS
ncbi:LOW QUALITY PROTEIN: SCO-spondin-like [Glossophaga mutica]